MKFVYFFLVVFACGLYEVLARGGGGTSRGLYKSGLPLFRGRRHVMQGYEPPEQPENPQINSRVRRQPPMMPPPPPDSFPPMPSK